MKKVFMPSILLLFVALGFAETLVLKDGKKREIRIFDYDNESISFFISKNPTMVYNEKYSKIDKIIFNDGSEGIAKDNFFELLAQKTTKNKIIPSPKTQTVLFKDGRIWVVGIVWYSQYDFEFYQIIPLGESIGTILESFKKVDRITFADSTEYMPNDNIVEELKKRNIENIYSEPYEFVDSTNKSKNEAHGLIMKWIAQNYNDATRILKLNDKESGQIVVRAFCDGPWIYFANPEEPEAPSGFWYTMTILMKDNKVKYIFATDYSEKKDDIVTAVETIIVGKGNLEKDEHEKERIIRTNYILLRKNINEALKEKAISDF